MAARTSSEGPDGVLLLDKPAGPTSHDLVARVRRALGLKRVGHAGTLDPFATGLLVTCVGRATRLVRFLTGSAKTYEGVVRFGFATDSGDSTGRPLAEPRRPSFDEPSLRAGISSLTGELEQVPPMFSAKKQGGRRLHQLAREGLEVERPPVPVAVSDWWLGEREGERLPFRVTVSAGTYVRVLAQDLGAAVGCPAHLESLRRIGSGSLSLEGALAVGPGRDDGPTPEQAREALIPLDRVPLPLDEAELGSPEALSAFAHGRAIEAGAWSGGEPGAELAVRGRDGGLAGVATVSADGALKPSVVLVDPPPGAD